MSANFTNTSRGEYSREPDEPASDGDARRVVYASWYPDGLKLAVIWVREFKERIAGFVGDDLLSKVCDEPGESGTVRATSREAIAAALGDVTDFVVVATGPYFAAQKRQGECELGWIIESSSAGPRHVVWVAALEGRLSFKGRKAGDCDLAIFPGWHPTNSDSDPLEPYIFFKSDDSAAASQFGVQLNAAVDRVLGHGSSCSVCAKTKQRP